MVLEALARGILAPDEPRVQKVAFPLEASWPTGGFVPAHLLIGSEQSMAIVFELFPQRLSLIPGQAVQKVVDVASS